MNVSEKGKLIRIRTPARRDPAVTVWLRAPPLNRRGIFPVPYMRYPGRPRVRRAASEPYEQGQLRRANLTSAGMTQPRRPRSHRAGRRVVPWERNPATSRARLENIIIDYREE